MVSHSRFGELALAFDKTVEQPHFEKTSFRVNRKIFATLDEKKAVGVLKLSAIDQSVFCAFDPAAIYPVPGGWGKQGWTMLVLKKIKTAMLKHILQVAYCQAAPKKLAEK